jgi:hypothetical protein
MALNFTNLRLLYGYVHGKEHSDVLHAPFLLELLILLALRDETLLDF